MRLGVVFCFFFFFSSRRRHTRLQGDWSSDVCSSDLNFETDVRPERQDFLVSINPESLLLEGARRVDEWSLIEKKIPSFDLIFLVDRDRKSTRLNSSHLVISYAVFCLKKKKVPTLNTPLLSSNDQPATRSL